MNRSPVIGITTDYKEKENTYSKYPWFALRRHYSDCLYKFGCTPIILPITETLENIDFLEAYSSREGTLILIQNITVKIHSQIKFKPLKIGLNLNLKY